MTSILSFKKNLIEALNNYSPLNKKIIGVFTSSAEKVNLPIIKLGNLFAEDWSSYLISGRVFDLTLEVISSDVSSKPCMEIMDIVESYFHSLKEISADFKISKVKVLNSKLNFIKVQTLWVGEIRVKFWIETVH